MNVLVIDIGGSPHQVSGNGADRGASSSPPGPISRPSRCRPTCWRQPRSGRTRSCPSASPVRSPITSRPRAEESGPRLGGIRFHGRLGRPVKLVNDAAMQALGSYEGGRMLFLGLGTGLGNTLVLDSKTVVAMEAGHLPYRKGQTFEDYVGQRGLDRFGRKKWRRFVNDVATRLRLAFIADYVVLGGGNSRLLKELPRARPFGQERERLPGRVSPLGRCRGSKSDMRVRAWLRVGKPSQCSTLHFGRARPNCSNPSSVTSVPETSNSCKLRKSPSIINPVSVTSVSASDNFRGPSNLGGASARRR